MTEPVQQVDELIVSTKRPDALQLNESLKSNFDSIEDKLNCHFDALKASLDLRRSCLLQELHANYAHKQGILNNYLNERLNEKENSLANESKKILNFINNEKYDFITDTYFSKETPADQDLISIIQKYGKVFKSTSSKLIAEAKLFSKDQMDCKLEGVGLRECYLNAISKFTLTFNNLDASLKMNVSFLDIFILTANETSSTGKPRVERSSIGHSALPKRRLTSSNSTSSISSTSKSNLETPKRCKCDCQLECVADGVYAVNYKLNKKGTYLLNILVNKNHVGESPYKIKCIEATGVKPVDLKARKSIRTQTPSNSGLATSSPRTTDPKTVVKSKYVNRTSSMSHLSNISNMSNKKSSLPNTFSISNGFNFNNNDKPQPYLISNRTDDDLINFGPQANSDSATMPKSNTTNGLSNKEDDFLFQIGSRGI